MPAQTYGLSTSSIFWDVEQTDVNQDSVEYVTISCVGYMKASGNTLSNALTTIPFTIPITSSGPVLLSSELAGAGLNSRSVTFTGDGRIECRATYKLPASSLVNPGQDEQTSSSADKFDLRVEVEEVPLLAHPVAQAFPLASKNKLKNLLEGDIIANPKYDGTTDTKEFIYSSDIDNASAVEVTFSGSDITVNGISASPLDYARMIKAGIESYLRPAVRWTWQCARNTYPSNSELNKVGDVVSPPDAPNITDDRDWLYTGISVAHEADGAFTISREFVLSERGGALQEIYKGGGGTISP